MEETARQAKSKRVNVYPMGKSGESGEEIPFGKEERRLCVLHRDISWTAKSRNFKIRDGKVGRNKVYHEKSAEVIVGIANTEGPNVCIVSTHYA